jgi:D-sedoheptulose 7-phosphate isomerase
MSQDEALNQLYERYPCLSSIKEMIAEAAGMIINCYSHNGKLLICGNGGSCSDAEHMVAELMKSFEIKRNLEPGFKNHLREISAAGVTILQKIWNMD